MSNPTIPDLKKEKIKLEQELSKSISKFQSKYGITVTNIDLEHVLSGVGKISPPMKTDVKIETKIY